MVQSAIGKRSIAQTAHAAETLTNSEADPIDDNARERHSDAMKREDLIALASPPCKECGAPVQRVETRWHLDEDHRWRPGPCFMVCADEHRVLVQALE